MSETYEQEREELLSMHSAMQDRILAQDAEIDQLRAAAKSTVASIQTRCGQIDKARATFGTNAVSAMDQIEHAANALKTAALDLNNVLRAHHQ